MEKTVEKEKDFQGLINELVENRRELVDLLDKVKEVKNNIDKLVPTSSEFRNRYVLEQKIKTIVEIIKSELEIRKQIDNSIRSEFDLRKKAEKFENDDFDISKLSMLLEHMGPDITEVDDSEEESEEETQPQQS